MLVLVALLVFVVVLLVRVVVVLAWSCNTLNSTTTITKPSLATPPSEPSPSEP